MKKILVIGIGAGDPEHLTVQAVNALNAVDVFLVVDKGDDKGELVRFRRAICERYVKDGTYRWAEAAGAPVRDADGKADVAAWRRRRQETIHELIAGEVAEGQVGAFLVWGDPSLYDGTIGILRNILAQEPDAFAFEVIPGISSVQALAARHRIPLNRVGEAVQITTGRRLASGRPQDAENLVVMLDAEGGLAAAAGEDFDIYWGAYLGTGDEILRAGRLKDLAEDIARIRAERRAAKGWIMDTYLLRRRARE